MLFLPRQVISVILPLMAVITEVSGSPAEPRRHLTAEFTLVIYKVLPMDFAVSHTCGHDRRALPANQFLSLELSGVVIRLSTISETAEIRLFAFVTHEVTQFPQGVFLRIIIELVLRILQSRILVVPFMLQAL